MNKHIENLLKHSYHKAYALDWGKLDERIAKKEWVYTKYGVEFTKSTQRHKVSTNSGADRNTGTYN